VNVEHINSAPIPSTGKPYSQATRFGDLVFVSGQVAIDEATSVALDGGFEVQARNVFENLKSVLEHAGASLETVLKTTCFLADMRDAPTFNAIYREYFPSDQPARSTFQVASLSPGLLVEVEAVAAVSSRPSLPKE
jgi:2-iminobutanoate/2-iminopropanoate deaminase